MFEIFYVFLKIGIVSFGAGYSLLPFFQREIVDVQKWLTNSEFTDIVTISSVAPGPLTIKLCAIIGFKKAGILGAISGVIGWIFPSLLLIVVIAILFYQFKDLKTLQCILDSMKPAVAGLALATVWIMIKGINKVDYKHAIIGCVVCMAFIFLKIHPTILILLTGLIDWVIFKR